MERDFLEFPFNPFFFLPVLCLFHNLYVPYLSRLSFFLYLFFNLCLYLLETHFGISSFSHPDNALEICGLLTPLHIVPEWYFLCQYAMLISRLKVKTRKNKEEWRQGRKKLINTRNRKALETWDSCFLVLSLFPLFFIFLLSLVFLLITCCWENYILWNPVIWLLSFGNLFV